MSAIVIATIVIPGACAALFVASMRWLGRHVTCAAWRPDLAEHYSAGREQS